MYIHTALINNTYINTYVCIYMHIHSVDFFLILDRICWDIYDYLHQ